MRLDWRTPSEFARLSGFKPGLSGNKRAGESYLGVVWKLDQGQR